MDNKRTHDAQIDQLKALSAAEFAALGAEHVVFIRRIGGDELARIFPDIADVSALDELNLLMAADGSPVLVTDSDAALSDWLSDHDVGLATVH